MHPYQYTQSGLDNVFLEGIETEIDDTDQPCVRIPSVRELHRVIATGIVQRESAFSPAELRFLRTELGLTQAQLALIVHVDTQTVGRWERGETPIQETADTVIRRLAIERLGLPVDLGIDELARRATPSAVSAPIRIDGRSPPHYRLAA
jgi:DNA-binding transcriptional regulator YiaG